MSDLFVAQLFRSAEQAVASVTDDDIDLAEVGESVAHDPLDSGPVRHIQMVQPQEIAVLLLEIVHRIHLAVVPATRSPRARSCSVITRPKPLFTPVINHVRCVIRDPLSE